MLEAKIQSNTLCSTIPPSFNTRRPDFLQRGSFLSPGLQNAFNIGYFAGSKEMVPTGWHTVDEDKTYPYLSSRNPQLAQSHDTSSMSGYEASNGRAGSEGSEDNFHAGAANTRMNDESSDEDEEIPAIAKPRVSQPYSLDSIHSYTAISSMSSVVVSD